MDFSGARSHDGGDTENGEFGAAVHSRLGYERKKEMSVLKFSDIFVWCRFSPVVLNE